jgi:hypothetical protein
VPDKYEGPERRKNGNNDWSSLPTWAKILLAIGPTAAIAVYLTYMGANKLPSIESQGIQNLNELRIIKELVIEHKKSQDDTYRLMQWICSGVQKNDADRKQCFEK